MNNQILASIIKYASSFEFATIYHSFKDLPDFKSPEALAIESYLSEVFGASPVQVVDGYVISHNPPFCNTGGIPLSHSIASVFTSIPPARTVHDFCYPSIGISPYLDSDFYSPVVTYSANFDLRVLPVSIDYLNFTLRFSTLGALLKKCYMDSLGQSDLIKLEDDHSTTDYIFKDDDYLAKAFFDEIQPLISDSSLFINSVGLHGYTKSANIYRGNVMSGKLAYGGNADTMHVNLTGSGCFGVSFVDLYNILNKYGAVITRVDFAHDDYENRDFSFKYWERSARDGLFFVNRGTRPDILYMNHSDTTKGDTFTIGNKKNGKEIQFYEKGKQLGMIDSDWYRCEVRLTNADKRVIPLDSLIYPAKYFLGAHSLLIKFARAANYDRDSIKLPSPKKAMIAYDHVVKYAKLSYGKLLYLMREVLEMTDKDIVEKLIRNEGSVPKRILINSY